MPTNPPSNSGNHYRLGEQVLGVVTNAAAFRERFHQLYADCQVEGVPASIRAEVRVGAGSVTATFGLPMGMDLRPVVGGMLTARGFSREDLDGALKMVAPGRDLEVKVRASGVVVSDSPQWPELVGNLLVHLTMTAQRDLLFFHGASVNVAGQGIMMLGPKGAGKSTLSVALAARGHGFLGDEIACVRLASRQLLPFRRSVAIRVGPHGDYLRSQWPPGAHDTVPYPDGSVRYRIPIGRAFPAAGAACCPLRHVVWVRGFAHRAGLEPTEPEIETLGRYAPLALTTWRESPVTRLIQVIRLMSVVQCHALTVGGMEETLDLIEQLGTMT